MSKIFMTALFFTFYTTSTSIFAQVDPSSLDKIDRVLGVQDEAQIKQEERFSRVREHIHPDGSRSYVLFEKRLNDPSPQLNKNASAPEYSLMPRSVLRVGPDGAIQGLRRLETTYGGNISQMIAARDVWVKYKIEDGVISAKKAERESAPDVVSNWTPLTEAEFDQLTKIETQLSYMELKKMLSSAQDQSERNEAFIDFNERTLFVTEPERTQMKEQDTTQYGEGVLFSQKPGSEKSLPSKTEASPLGKESIDLRGPSK